MEMDIFNKTKQLKMNATVNGICNDDQLFVTSLNYVRNLAFGEMPDYLYLQSLFQTYAPVEITKQDEWIIVKINIKNKNIIINNQTIKIE